MRFVNYFDEIEGKNKIASLKDNLLYDVSGCDDMIKFIEEFEEKNFRISKTGKKIDGIKLNSPIIHPVHDIICAGKNYKDHVAEIGGKMNMKMYYFSKRAEKILGDMDKIKARFDLDDQVDYEAELAVIIGKRCTDLKEDEVMENIFGYSVFNDLSSRKLQADHRQWFRGKSLDNYSIMGPCILTKEDINPFNLEIKTYVNGELRQNSNTSLMLFDIKKMISEISQGITLVPGDIIITGTPAGVGLGFNPPRYLKNGDIVRCEIEKIGKIENEIIK